MYESAENGIIVAHFSEWNRQNKEKGTERNDLECIISLQINKKFIFKILINFRNGNDFRPTYLLLKFGGHLPI